MLDWVASFGSGVLTRQTKNIIHIKIRRLQEQVEAVVLKVNLTLLFRVGWKMNYTEMTGKHLNKYRNLKKAALPVRLCSDGDS